MVDINEIVKIAKQVLVERKSHAPQAIIENRKTKALEIVVLAGMGDDNKDYAIDTIRLMVEKAQAERYWMIMEGWMTIINKGEKIYRRPRDDKDRTSALIISEFRKDMNNQIILIPFKIERNKIVFDEERKKPEQHSSIWNVYLEKEGIEEGFDKLREKTNQEYFQATAKIMAKKFKARFENAKTGAEFSKLTRDIIQFAKDKADEQKKTIIQGGHNEH